MDELLQDKNFALRIAHALHDAYYLNSNQQTLPFILPEEETAVIVKSQKEEKIAINLAGLYALETGLGALAAERNKTIIELLKQIVDGKMDEASMLLLSRFANATWKAGQPFQDLNRISRPVFIGAGHLGTADIKKDEVQIINAATKLLASMKEVTNESIEKQMEQLRCLLQDSNYAIEMAAWLHACYYTGQNQDAPPFLTSDDDTATITKPVKQMKIGTSIAGFYALECGLNYFATIKKILPSEILTSVVNDTIGKEDKMLFARFANATWKAGQPFIHLSKIKEETFTPFYFLNEEAIQKDLAQIKKAAELVLEEMAN